MSGAKLVWGPALQMWAAVCQDRRKKLSQQSRVQQDAVLALGGGRMAPAAMHTC